MSGRRECSVSKIDTCTLFTRLSETCLCCFLYCCVPFFFQPCFLTLYVFVFCSFLGDKCFYFRMSKVTNLPGWSFLVKPDSEVDEAINRM